MLYNIVKKELLKNKELRESGKYVGVPMPFKRLSSYIPLCAERGHSIGILAATGAGKSRFTRFLYIYHCYKFYKQFGYPLRIIYFPLEDNKEKVMRNMICHYLHEIYGIYITLQELNSVGERILPEFVIEKIEEAEEFFKEFEQVVTIIDGLNEPTQIFNYLQNYALKTGKIETYYIDGQKQKRYVANNNIHTIVVIDNMSNIDQEEGIKDERHAMLHFCKTLVRGRLCNFFKFTVVQVLQQDFSSERQSFNQNGETMISKLEPSLAGVGNSKEITRSMHLVIGMFHPVRFGIITYPAVTKYNPEGYQLDVLGNRFRSLHILKANDVDFGQKIPILFDAVTENMTELPELGSQELKDIYKNIRDKNPTKFSKITKIEYNEEENELPF